MFTIWMQRLLEPAVLPRVLQALRFLFLGLALLLWWRAMRVRANERRTPPRPGNPYRVVMTLMCLLFLAVWVYQASWQLTGFARPAFLEFMRKYSRRPINPARTLARGRILDCRGVELAANQPDNVLRRWYPLGSAACHVVGYRHPVLGITGLEAADNAYLSGYTLDSIGELDRFGRNLVHPLRAAGNDLVLTIDSRLQQEATRLMTGRRGAVVMLRPDTGDLLALVSAPAFDPNRFDVQGVPTDAVDAPMLNRAIWGLYPPGSLFKVVVAGLALDSGFRETFDCPASGYAPARGVRPIRDHEYYERARAGRSWAGQGRLDLRTALARSSNVFFAQLGVRLGGAAFTQAAGRFLFNERMLLYEGSSANLTASASALPDLSAARPADLAQTGIGQGRLLVTPLHMALIMAAVAQDGVLYRPRLTAREPPAVWRNLFGPRTAAALKEMLRNVVLNGTGRPANLAELNIAGKTGTAQAPGGPDHAWFACMAPVEAPAVALVVLVERGGYGSQAALPIAVKLVNLARSFGYWPSAAGSGAAAGGAVRADR